MKNFTVTFLVSVAIFGLIAFLVISFVLSALRSSPTPDITPDDSTAIDDPGPSPNVSEIAKSGGSSFTALLIGVDYQPTVFNDYIVGSGEKIGFANGSGEEYSLFNARTPSADAIVVVRVDKENGRIMLSSISRDTVLHINGGQMLLGDVLYQNGLDSLIEATTSLCGLPIDYYAMIDYDGLASVIDQIGGIEFSVPYKMNYEDSAEGLKIEIESGVQKLNGEKAVKLLRYNSYPDGNIQRMRLGVDFLKALLQATVSHTNLSDAPQLYASLKSCVKTNFTTADFLENLKMFLLYESFQKVVISYPGTVTEDNGTRRFEPNISAALELYRDYKFAG